jgi:uncharacterized protein (TIGR02246 family)
MIKKLLAVMSFSMLFAAPVMADDAATAPAAAPAADQAVPADQAAPGAPAKKMKAAKSMEDNSAKEAAIKKAFDDLSAAWAAGDAHAVASHWLADGSLINPFGQDAWSRAEVEKVAGADIESMKGSTQTFDDYKFTWILGGCALVDCTGTISGMKNADGTDAPNKQFHIVGVMVQRGDKWLARAIRPYAFVPAPGSTAAAPAAAAPAADESMPAKSGSKNMKDMGK